MSKKYFKDEYEALASIVDEYSDYKFKNPIGITEDCYAVELLQDFFMDMNNGDYKNAYNSLVILYRYLRKKLNSRIKALNQTLMYINPLAR